MKISPLVNMKMPTIVGIFIFISRENFILCHLPEKGRKMAIELANERKERNRTSKLLGEFMSPALFLFEVLKMGKLTRGPLVLYHRPKY